MFLILVWCFTLGNPHCLQECKEPDNIALDAELSRVQNIIDEHKETTDSNNSLVELNNI